MNKPTPPQAPPAGQKKANRDASVLERRFAPKGSKVMKQGEHGNNAFLIQSGRVKVYTESDDGRKVDLAEMDAGQIFGEMALVFDSPRTATVEALEDCNLIIITRQVLNEKLKKSDPTVRAIVPMLTNRILQANNALVNKMSNAQELIDAVSTIYQNIHATLPAAQKKSLENTVLPKLEDFLKSVKEFNARYSGT